jgi:predicted O-linked N-acetylglucosamine transferase (SPINDLY family)
MAASLLYAVGLPELVTPNLAEYEAMAIQLGNHPEQLAVLKQKLADNRLTYPLFNTSLFTHHIEDAYQMMFDRYQADLAPDHIYVPSRVGDAHPTADNANKFSLAMSLHQQERFTEAAELYEDILKTEPQHIDALHFLGVLKGQLGELPAAVDLIKQSLVFHPDNTAAYANLAMMFQTLNRFDEALTCYDKLLILTPNDLTALLARSNLLLLLARLDEALTSFDLILTIKSNSIEAFLGCGAALQLLELFDDALFSYNRALVINPNHAELLFGYANVLYKLERKEEALSAYNRSLAQNPNSEETLYNRGVVLADLNRIDEAIDSYQQVLAINPNYAEVNNNLGALFKQQERFEEAKICYQHAVKSRPCYTDAHCNLINLLKDQGQFAEANVCLANALAAVPYSLELRIIQLIMVLPMMPKTADESAAVPEQFDNALTALSTWLAESSDKHGCVTQEGLLPLPFLLAYRIGNHKQRLSFYGDLIADTEVRYAAPIAKQKIRMVVISHHFRRHSVWDVVTRGLLVNLDRSCFELILYHLGNIEDAETEFAKSLADQWRDTHSIDNVANWLAALQNDAPDVIFYPEIGMDPMSARLASYRLAPLQVASWGHPITTGLPTMDLYFSGELLESSEADSHYRERLIRLPNTGCCTTLMNIDAEPLMPELLAELEQRGGVRFIIAQTIYKFDPIDDGLYADIASVVPDSRFILLRDRDSTWVMDQIIMRLQQTFIERGLNPEQHLIIIPWQSMGRFQSLLDECDVYLDCPSFSGYTTAWQAVHRGIPIITLEGEFMRQRLAAGLLRKIGITDTIVSSRQQYVQCAAQLVQECRDLVRYKTRREAIKNVAPKADNDVSVVQVFEQTILNAVAEYQLKY